MADANLNVELTAKVDNLEKNIASAVKTVTSANKQIDAAVEKTNSTLRDVNPASNKAAFALNNLGRVAQDAPFGFIAIQNNISPLIDSFGYLVKETGSVGGALKSLAGSLIGPAGIGLAIAAVTAGITLYIQHEQKVNAELKNSKKVTDDYIASLGAITAARVRGEQAGAGEVTRLELLYNATKDTTLSLKSRNEAYDELSSKYPKFFANSTSENRALVDNTTAYNNLSTAILSAAAAKAYEDQITKNKTRQIEDQQKILDLTIAESKARASVARNTNLASQPSSNLGTGSSSGVGYAQLAQQSQEKLNDLQQHKNDLLTDYAKLELQNTEFNRLATDSETKAHFKTNAQLDDGIKKTKQLKRDRTELIALSAKTGGFDSESFFTSLPGNASLGFGGDALAANTKSIIDNLDATNLVLVAQQDAAEQRNRNIALVQAETDVTNELTQTIGVGLTDAFSSMLTGGKNAFAQIGTAILQLVSKIIAATIAAAALAAILSFTGLGTFTSSFSTLSSSLSGVKGLGALISGGVPKLAEGGITTGPTLALIGEGKENEVVAPISKFNDMVNNRAGSMTGGEVTFRIEGNTLVGVLDRANKSKSRTS